MVLKSLKTDPLGTILLDYFTNRQSLKNLNVAFLTKYPQMLRMCYHLKSALW